MSFYFLDSSARSAWLAATTQQAQLEGLRDEWSGQMSVRYYSAADAHLATVTHATPIVDTGTTPYSLKLGAWVAESHVQDGTAAYCILAVPAGADILRCDVSLAGAISDPGGRVRLDIGTTLRVQATSTLPNGGVAPGNYRVGIWGQSNAAGRAELADLSASPLSSDPGLAAYAAGTFDRVWIWYDSHYAQLQPTVNSAAPIDQFGPEFGLAVRWMRETTTGNLYIHKAASSGVSITAFEPGGGYESYSYLETTNGPAWMAANSVTLDYTAWLWVQGEEDGGQTQEWYQTRLQDIIDEHISVGIHSASSKMVLAQMAVGSLAYDANVAAAKAAIAAASPTTIHTINLKHMGADNLHCNARGQVQLGYDAFEKIFGVSHIDA